MMKTKWMMMVGVVGLCGMTQAAFVTIGDAGNSADPFTGYGAVAYSYQISVTEVTIGEFMTSGAGDGDENYWNTDERTVGLGAPAVHVSLYEAMKYCNWRTSGDTLSGVYNFDGGGSYLSTDRESALATYGTIYALPTENEWYKAAYYTGNSEDRWSLYANGSDSVPIHGTATGWNYYNNGFVNESPNYMWTAGCGGQEQNGTYDMMGNAWEWMETSSGLLRGGNYGNPEGALRSSYRLIAVPTDENYLVGFRVVAVPEPATALSLVLGILVIGLHRRFF